MYASHQMLRVNHDDWLRRAETRRQITQAQASSAPPARTSRLRLRRPALRFGRRLRHA